jgi:hypothetical protein
MLDGPLLRKPALDLSDDFRRCAHLFLGDQLKAESMRDLLVPERVRWTLFLANFDGTLTGRSHLLERKAATTFRLPSMVTVGCVCPFISSPSPEVVVSPPFFGHVTDQTQGCFGAHAHIQVQASS